ncbi:MAG: hypothetical protein N3B12_04015 [Armatimonadetes bacterium]|nr:hypothetical protein [Armatimonadota bacterium]
MNSRQAQTRKILKRCVRANDPAVRTRALVLGLLLIPLNVYWVIAADLRWLNALTLNPLFVTPVFCLAVLLAANALLARLVPKLVLRPSELITVYIMLVMSCTVAAFDFIIGIMTSIPWPAWAASSQNEWDSRLIPYLPNWLIVTDRTALKGFFRGGAQLNEFMGAWLIPLLSWSCLIVIIVWMLLCLTVLLRKAWTENAKLAFPIVRLPLELTESSLSTSIFRKKLFWGGCAVAACLSMLNGLREYYPNLPALTTGPIPIRFDSVTWAPSSPTYISFQPSIIGLAFLVPLDVSFSCWFFYLFMKFQEIAGRLAGVADIPGFPFAKEQAIGAWYMFGIALIYGARYHLVLAVRSALGSEAIDDSREPFSYKVAFWGLLVGTILFVIFWRAAGMSAWLAILLVILFLLVSIAITRVRTEAGAQHTVTSVGPIGIFPLLGLESLGPTNAALGALSHAYWRGMRSHPMPNQMEALKLAAERGIDLRRLVMPIILSVVLATAFGFWSFLRIAYSEGALANCRGYPGWINIESYQWFSGVGAPQDTGRWSIVGASAGLILLLTWLRAKLVWFPLHPLGYCVGPGMVWVWCPFVVAWLIKLLLLRYGGLKLFREAMPFFLGLVFGDYTLGAAWSLVEVVWHLPAYHVF